MLLMPSHFPELAFFIFILILIYFAAAMVEGESVFMKSCHHDRITQDFFFLILHLLKRKVAFFSPPE